jgi:hypothetical protein
MICECCGQEIKGSVCPVCGHLPIQNQNHCPVCGNEIDVQFKCVCCGKNLERDITTRIGLPVRLLPPEFDCWNNGAVGLIEAGYGSRHDTKQMVIGLCDECITEKIKQKLILLIA